MTLLAAATPSSPTVTERFQQIPTEFWVRAGIAVAILVVAIIVLRKIAKLNKVVLGVVIFVGLTIVGFNWIYERNEPKWATPVVQWLASFFPSKGKPAVTPN